MPTHPEGCAGKNSQWGKTRGKFPGKSPEAARFRRGSNPSFSATKFLRAPDRGALVFFSSCFLKPLSDKSHYPADLKFLSAQSENFLFQDPL